MSYEIFTSIKYNKTTRNFDCASYSNNVWPKIPNKWTMDYFAKKYPDATERELKALLILAGLYTGDKYKSHIAWANEYQRVARLWGSRLEKTPDCYDINVARDLAAFYEKYTQENQKKRYVLKNALGQYVAKINPTSFYLTSDVSSAKTFDARNSSEIMFFNGVKYLIEYLVENRGFVPTEI